MTSRPVQTSLEMPDLPGVGKGWELLLPHAELRRRCTAEVAVKCDQQRIAILQSCVHLGTRQVAEAYGISREVVRKLRTEALRTGELDQLKEEEGRRLFAIADLLVDRLEDEIDRIPIASVALNLGIIIDKAQLLSGAPTMRIQHNHALSVAQIADYIDALPSVTPVREGEFSVKELDLVSTEIASDRDESDAPKDSHSFESGASSEVAPSPAPDDRLNDQASESPPVADARARIGLRLIPPDPGGGPPTQEGGSKTPMGGLADSFRAKDPL